ncbi:MAG: hypothetical protein PHD21_02030 [Flavobacteriales bacterium]|nr:hypothetical protein [Flavobacteriales bacterium]
MDKEKENVLIDVFFRRFYLLWGSVMLIYPVAVCMAWFFITRGASDVLEAKMMFMGAFTMFTYFQFTWMLSVLLSAIPFFFGLRLLNGKTSTKIVGALMMLVSAGTMVFSVLRIWSA